MRRKAKKWDSSEEEVLRTFYSIPDGIDYLQITLKRSRESIWAKAARLKLPHFMYFLRDKITVGKMKMNTAETTDGCWEWMGPRMNSGYGSMTIDHKTYTAHRVMFKTAFPNLSISGWNVNHSCDNPACVNPKHLYRGTQKDNIQDQLKRGRHRWNRRSKEV